MHIDWDLQVNNHAIQAIVKRVRKSMHDAAYEAALKIMSDMELDLTRIYYNIVKEFYDDYDPGAYDRNESLYKLLEINNTNSRITWGFDPSMATPFERGGGTDGLYEHVFRQGWHGGATGVDKNGYSVSVPSWRFPVPFYSKWGTVAEQAPRSPLEAWQQEVDVYKHDVLPRRYRMLYHNELRKRGLNLK